MLVTQGQCIVKRSSFRVIRLSEQELETEEESELIKTKEELSALQVESHIEAKGVNGFR